MPQLEYQAVVMAGGKGSRMTELTAKKAKCLLPIGNMPMVWFPLHLLEKSGFQEVIVVVPESSKAEVQLALDKCSLKMRIDLFGVPESGEDIGTADSLRSLQEANKIKSDLIVLSCDLISDVDLTPLFEVYRKHNAALAALFVKQNSSGHTTVIPGPKTKDKIERDFVGVSGTTSRMVFIGSASDYEESLPITQKLLKKCGRVTLHTKLLDAHIYVINKWLCEYLVLNKSLSAIKGELLPHVVKKHLADSNQTKASEDKASVVAMNVKTELSQFGQECILTDKIRLMSTYTDERSKIVYNDDIIRCYAVIAESNAIRANTLSNYCRINREIVHSWENITSKKLTPISPSAVIKSTQLDKDSCLVGEKTQIAEKTSIRGSIIGSNVSISPKTQVVNSIIMSGAKIGEGCSIQNSILCEECEVEGNCELKDCLVGSHHIVVKGGKHVNEVLTDIDRLMEI